MSPAKKRAAKQPAQRRRGTTKAAARTPGRRGRPLLLTDEVHTQLVDSIRAGSYYYVAARACGIDPRTFELWRKRGRAEHDRIEDARARGEDDTPLDTELPFLTLFRDIQKAEAEGEVALVTFWRLAAANDWRAARDLLARRHPDRWKERSETQLPPTAEQMAEQTSGLEEADLWDVLEANPHLADAAVQLEAAVAIEREARRRVDDAKH